LDLQEAIRIAVENQPRIEAAMGRVGAQKAVVGQQLSAYYPTITQSNTYRTSNSSGGGDSVSDRGVDRFTGQATMNMTLYDFGKREGGVQAARESLEATRHDYRTVINDVVLSVKQAYFVYLGATALVKVREETVKARELLVRQASAFYEVGTRPRIDVARAEANLYSAQADLIATQNGVKVAWASLKNAMGVPDLPERPLTEELTAPVLTMTLDEAKAEAFGARSELYSFEAQKRAQDQRVAVARRGHLPDILFTGIYGRTGTSPRSNTDRNDTFPLQPTWTAQLTFSIPIFEGFNTTYRIEEAMKTYQTIRAQEEIQRQQVALDVEQSYLRVLEARERIKATEAAERAAKENLDLANGRYEVGVGSIIEVTDAQTLYTSAVTDRIRSFYDYKIFEAQLARAVGSGVSP
jgi:outer membrane protein TolC